MKFTWSTPYETDQTESNLPGWSYPIMNRLPFVNDPETHRAVSLSIGQNMYTPEDKNRSDLIEDDRPYAGIIYIASGFHSRTERRKNSWEFNIGLVGPHSYAEETQNWIHDLTGTARFRGWDNQLKDEFIFEAVSESKWRLRLFQSEDGRDFSYDFIPHVGGRIGSARTYANAGAEARFGWRLPKDFGTCPIRTGCETDSSFDEIKSNYSGARKVGFHFFVATDGRLVLWDITLDGNIFKDSQSVDKKVFVADLIVGIALEYNKIKASYSYIYRTKQFETQDYDTMFGAISISLSY